MMNSMSEVDAILVLGCGIDKHCQLNEDARKSVELGSRLFNQLSASWLIFSGNHSYKADFVPPISESQAMKDYATNLKIPEDKILVEAESKDTLGNAYFSKVNLLDPLNLKQIIIVGGPNQSEERLRYIFDKVCGTQIKYKILQHNVDRPKEHERERKSLVVTKNWLSGVKAGDTNAIYQIMRMRHPAYTSNQDALKKLKTQLEDA